MRTSALEACNGVGVIRLDNPPVNALGVELRGRIVESLDRANADPSIHAIVIIGSDRAFSGGADIAEFESGQAFAQPDLPAVVDALDASAKPVIAAISGLCLGGGLELALGCQFRVATPTAQIGLPEVKLGLIPGAGGTQRLPRLIGIEPALNMIVSGSALPASSFKGTALIDELVEGNLLDAAIAFARAVIRDRREARRARDIQVDSAGAAAFLQFARNMVKASKDAFPAPLACIDAVAASTMGFDKGMICERELFTRLLTTSESIALRHIFRAERAAGRSADLPAGTQARDIKRVGVIGAGTMGSGIAMNFLNAGMPVVLLEAKQEALDKGIATIRSNYDRSVKRGELSPQELEQRMGMLTAALDYGLLADVDLAIEAVFESMEVKETVFRKLDAAVKPGAVLASNTSYLDIDRIAGFTDRPQDVVGLHFFSPANVMRLLEIVRGAQTGADVLATVVQLAKRIRKIAVIAGVCDGFIGNRMLQPYIEAAEELVAVGAMPQDVDHALQKFGMAMGPFRMMDLAGLDIGWAMRKRKRQEQPSRDFGSIADPLCAAGRFGQKAGAGWYRYEPGNRDPIPDPVTAKLIDEYRASKGITPRRVSADEIVQRCIYALVNEGARIVEEGIAERASDLDVVYLNGYGLPKSRGGPMCFADQVGLPKVVRALRQFAAGPGEGKAAWMPARLLMRLAAEGKTFN